MLYLEFTSGFPPSEARKLSPPTRFQRIGRRLKAMVLVVVVVICGMVGMLYSFQTKMIFPGSATQGTAAGLVELTPGTELVRFKTKAGDAVTALFGPALDREGKPLPDAEKRPTLLYFYGNGTCLGNAAKYDIDAFRRLGVNMLIPDYVGYGMSGGHPSEANCYATADAALEHLMSRADVDPSKVIAMGRSLGGAVAIDLASRSNLAGLVVFSTFTSMSDMSKQRYPVPLLTLLLRHKFESLSKIPKVRCPILIGHGAADTFVPAGMSRTLADACRSPVTYFDVPGVDHNNFYQLGGAKIVEELRRFVESATSSQSGDGV